VPLISRRSLDTGRSSSSNLVGETRVPRNAPGTPQANACFPAGAGACGGTSDSARERRGELSRRTGSRRTGEHADPRVGLGGKTGWAWGRQGGLAGRRERARKSERVSSGRTRGWAEGELPGTRKRTVGPRTVRPPIRANGAIWPAPPPSRKCRADPLGHHFMEPAITRELRRAY
jgi:hypothetical protein